MVYGRWMVYGLLDGLRTTAYSIGVGIAIGIGILEPTVYGCGLAMGFALGYGLSASSTRTPTRTPFIFKLDRFSRSMKSPKLI